MTSIVDEEHVYLGLNEPRCGQFELYDNGRPNEWSYLVPRSLWTAVLEAEASVKNATAAYAAAVGQVVDHIKTAAPPDDGVRDYRVDEDGGIFW